MSEQCVGRLVYTFQGSEPGNEAIHRAHGVGAIRPFEFNRMGVRVPTILVSPWVEPGTVFRAPEGSKFDFDHTSLLATILLWAGIDPRTAKLGTRVANAPTFQDVLSTNGYDNKPTFVVPEEYAAQGGPKGPHNIPFDVEGVPIATIRSLMDAATSAEQFLEFLRIVVDRL